MVSTRSHPSNFPPPNLSPSKIVAGSPQSTRTRGWTHTPDTVTLLWLLISLPLVCWDIAYVLLRPHSMPNGSLHSPMFAPYALYGTVDYVYGFKAYNEHSGFTAAQASLNVFETVGYLAYLWIVWRFGEGEKRVLGGGWGGAACLAGYSLSVMTVSKTVLYWCNEFFSGFSNIGHNDPTSLVFLWVIPNGAWIVLPTYMAYIFACEILRGLAIASDDSSSRPAKAVESIKDE